MEEGSVHRMHCGYSLQVSSLCGAYANTHNTYLAHVCEDVEDLNLLQPVAQSLVEQVDDTAA